MKEGVEGEKNLEAKSVLAMETAVVWETEAEEWRKY